MAAQEGATATPGPFDDLDVAAEPRELVAVGGRLDVETLVAAYRAGIFPWPATGRYGRQLDRHARQLARAGEVRLLPGGDPRQPLVPWCSPDPRAVLLTDNLHLPRSLRQVLRRRHWTTTVDTAFDEVLAACGDRAEGTWITGAMVAGYRALHRAGWAHSLEVWDGDRLVGGLYGVLSGSLFSGESMFHREDGASKVAVVDLCQRLLEAGVVLLDTQQETPHLQALGQVTMHRADYLVGVTALRDRPAALPTERRHVSRLVPGAS